MKRSMSKAPYGLRYTAHKVPIVKQGFTMESDSRASSISREPYTAIFFDLYGTLVDAHTEEDELQTFEEFNKWLSAQGCHFASATVLREHYRKALSQVQSALPDGVADIEHEFDIAPVFVSILRAGMDAHSAITASMVQACATAFRAASNRKLEPYPHAASLLALLRAWGLTTVLVSNAQSLFTRPELEDCSLAKSFDHVLISSEEGIRKPNKAFFERACVLVPCTAQSALMVGNEEVNDIQGAGRAGIDAFYLHTSPASWGQPETAQDAVCSVQGADYYRLAQYIAQHNGLTGEAVQQIDRLLNSNE